MRGGGERKETEPATVIEGSVFSFGKNTSGLLESVLYHIVMRLIVQRVSKTAVKVKEKVVGEIPQGLLVLVGIKKGDSLKDAETLVEKLYKLRVMADKEGKMNLAVSDTSGEFLVVSQFTLYADTAGGNRPSFINAAEPTDAKKIYEHFLSKLKEKGAKLETGSFGEYMEISAELDGPVTIILET